MLGAKLMVGFFLGPSPTTTPRCPNVLNVFPMSFTGLHESSVAPHFQVEVSDTLS